MKRITLLLLLLLFTLFTSSLSFSQTIGKVQHIKINKLESGNYHLHYMDYKFKQIEDYKSFEIEDLETLFEAIMSNFDKMPKDDIKYKLSNGTIIWLHFEKSLGIKSFQFTHAVNYNPPIIGLSRYLTKKQVIKLFGKKKKKK